MSTTWYNPHDFNINVILERPDIFTAIQSEAMWCLANDKFTHHGQSSENIHSPLCRLANTWNVVNLFKAGVAVPGSDKLAPFTVNFLSQFEEITKPRLGLVYFSLIPAGGVVIPHVSTLAHKARIRNQLALMVPDTVPGDEVFFDILGERRGWELGKCMSFDDSYSHYVKNLSSMDRLVLLYDIVGPLL